MELGLQDNENEMGLGMKITIAGKLTEFTPFEPPIQLDSLVFFKVLKEAKEEAEKGRLARETKENDNNTS